MRHACFSFYLSGLLGIGRAREVGAAGMNGGSCRSFLICKLFPCYGCTGIGGCLHLSSRERKAVDAPAVMPTALLRWQPGAWALATLRFGSTSPEHEKVPSWTHLGLFLLLRFLGSFSPASQSIIFLIRFLWSLVLSQPLWIFASPCSWSNKSILVRELHLITT